MISKETYENPLVERYASKEMLKIFSPLNKYTIWHKLWLCLAQTQKELGLSISDEQIAEMENNLGKIDFEKVAFYEKKTRHEVMAHIQAWGEVCPKARPIIHLGATSAFVMDNGDLIQMAQGLKFLRTRLVALLKVMADFAKKYHDLPALGYTHFQPAQLTTVGKRAALWIYDFILDFEDLENRITNLKLRGVKGTVGTQDSFMKLFDNNEEKVKLLDKNLSQKMGFLDSIPVSGQTYTRKIDYLVLTALSNLAQSAHKIGTDIRLLQGMQELEEPFESSQIGSSAMPYKRNPMRSERVCSLSRMVMQWVALAGENHGVQWLERSLDDSANRRMLIPEVFLATDAFLSILTNIFSGLQVYPKVIEKRIQENLPFLSAEYVMMESVKKGADRQDVHEAFRELAMQAVKEIKEEGKTPNLIQHIAQSSRFPLDKEEVLKVLDSFQMVGRASGQTLELLKEWVEPILKKYPEKIEPLELKV